MKKEQLKIEAVNKDQKHQALEEMEKTLKEWTSTSVGRRSFIASMPLLLASCATVPQTRYREGDNTGQATTITVADEQRMTSEVLAKMVQDYPPVRHTDLQNFVKGIGRKVAVSNGYEGNPYNYNFTLVQSKNINAFALPAGTVFVTDALLNATDSEAELAGVIGHEIGHVKARHTAERISATQQTQGKSLKYLLGGGVLGGALGLGLGSLVCARKDAACRARMTQYGAMAGASGGLLIQKYGFMANSREDEMEADRVGYRTAVGAGYDSNHVGNFYSKLLEMEQRSKASSQGSGGIMSGFADAMSTHPPSVERVKQMKQMAAEAPKKGLVSSDRYLALKKISKSLAAAS